MAMAGAGRNRRLTNPAEAHHIARFCATLPGTGVRRGRGRGMFTREILFGLNILTLAGFVLMGIGLTLFRQRKVQASIAFALMGAGTALVFLGIYVAAPANP